MYIKKKKCERITRTVYLANHYNIHINVCAFLKGVYIQFHSYNNNNNITSLHETIILGA